MTIYSYLGEVGGEGGAQRARRALQVAKATSPLQAQEVGACRVPYLLVIIYYSIVQYS